VERGFCFQVVHRSNGAICLPMFDFPHLDNTVQALNALKLFPRGYQQINEWDRHPRSWCSSLVEGRNYHHAPSNE